MLAVGARFSDNHTSNWRNGKIYDLARTKIVQVDLDIAEVGRNYPVEVGIAGDAAVFLEELLAGVDAAGIEPSWSGWTEQATAAWDAWREEIHPTLTAESTPVHPARLCYEIGEALAAVDGRIFVDIGDVTQYAEPYMTIRGPGRWHINPGMAEMGWASSGVLGAVAADPKRPALCLVGDGAFNMTSQVLATAVEYGLPAVWVILDNCEFGIERKGSIQDLRSCPSLVSVHPQGHRRAVQPGLRDAGAGKRRRRGPDRGSARSPRRARRRASRGGKPFVIDVVQDTDASRRTSRPGSTGLIRTSGARAIRTTAR